MFILLQPSQRRKGGHYVVCAGFLGWRDAVIAIPRKGVAFLGFFLDLLKISRYQSVNPVLDLLMHLLNKAGLLRVRF